jgi:rifampicin phosphotransferase
MASAISNPDRAVQANWNPDTAEDHPSDLVVELAALRSSMVPTVGGRAANLGELMSIDGVRVPDGFCITTAA